MALDWLRVLSAAGLLAGCASPSNVSFDFAVARCDDGTCDELRTIDGSSFGEARTMEDGWLELELERRHRGDPEVADDEATGVLSFEVQPDALAEGETVSFSGTNELTWPSSAVGVFSPESTSWTPEDGGGAVRDVWSVLHCYCDRRESATQRIAGTLVVERVGESRLAAIIEVDAEGEVPGVALGPATAHAEGTFDLAAP